MNLDELKRKLIGAARAHPPSDGVPYAFSKRIMALLQAAPPVDHWALWARALWRSAAACVAIALLSGALTLLVPRGPAPSRDLSMEFEKTMLAAVDQDPELPQ